jgi:spore germination cell wall hydrolase CwlJ-like protein
MYNSQRLDASLVSKTWNILLAVMSITFIWNTILTGTNAYALSKQEPSINIATHTIVAPPPIPSREELLEQQYENARLFSIVETGETVQYSTLDFICLSLNIYYEARGEPITGRYAVAQVTLNRAEDPRFGDNICDVVYAPYQFSWTSNHRRGTIPRGDSWQEARHIALDVLENGKRVKGMEEALYFHANYVSPNWRNVERLTRIGAHVFYAQNE